jgi:hypothetical protein
MRLYSPLIWQRTRTEAMRISTYHTLLFHGHEIMQRSYASNDHQCTRRVSFVREISDGLEK